MRWLLLAATIPALLAAKEDPVQWTLAPAKTAVRVAPGGKAYLELKAIIQPGWHLYSPTTPPGGPIITKIALADNAAIAGYKVYRPQPVRKLDPNFQIDTETYTGEAAFLIEATAASSASGNATIDATIRYQACTDVKCLPPVRKTATTQLSIEAGAPAE
ncbi:MAG: protein-disulfide reductase DsbD N-terminal domain-containing protein, partial [Acidobacteriaceae bacterium]|nr:protein-disulfide reductase DsbD N-terminal domain-containing protein [Acidobacteriaceae bacterium]